MQTRPPQPHRSDIETSEKRRPAGSFKETLKVPGFVLITVIFCGMFSPRWLQLKRPAFQITNFAYDGIFTVYTYTSVEHGGLSLPVGALFLSGGLQI